jgi:hypothetical protein
MVEGEMISVIMPCISKATVFVPIFTICPPVWASGNPGMLRFFDNPLAERSNGCGFSPWLMAVTLTDVGLFIAASPMKADEASALL